MSDFYINAVCIGNNILFKGVKGGKKVKVKIPYKPKLYVKSNKKTQFQNLEGYCLEQIPFDSIRDARDFIEQYKDIENFKIYGNSRYDYAFISEVFPNIIEWDREKIHVVNIDIEVGSENGFPNPDSASEPVTAIACKFSQSKEYYIFGCGDYKKHRDDVIYFKCKDEYDLIEKFLQIWNEKSPDIVTGWNVKTFDIPYLVNRIRRLFDDSKAKGLSPWGMVSDKTTTIMTREIKYYELIGISILDYLEMYRKFNTNGTAESFRLDHIANIELGERKLSYSEYDNLHELYRLDFQKFIEYNQKDVELVERLDEKLKLLDLALTLAYDSKTNYPDVFMQVRMWTEIIQNHLRSKNIFLEAKRKDVNRTAFEGAFVKDPIIGMHEWVASFDLTSLYPSLIMMYNISPDTIIESKSDEMRQCSVNVDKLLSREIDTSFLKTQMACLTPNNQFFSLEKKGFLAEIMESMFIDRQKYKKEMLSAQKEYEAIKKEMKRRGLQEKFD